MSEDEEPKPIFEDHSNESLKKIANDILNGHIFTDRHIPAETDEDYVQTLSMVFMPVGLGMFSNMSKHEAQKIGMVYEYLSQAGPRSVNGLPMFMSIRLLTKKQLEKVDDFITRFSDAYNSIETDGEP